MAQDQATLDFIGSQGYHVTQLADGTFGVPDQAAQADAIGSQHTPQQVTSYLTDAATRNGVDPSAAYGSVLSSLKKDANGFAEFVGSGNLAPTSEHITTDLQGVGLTLGGDGIVTTQPVSRNFDPNHPANDTNPATKLPVSPILKAIGITVTPPVVVSPVIPPVVKPVVPPVTPPTTGTDPISTLASLIAAQYAAAGSGGDSNGIVALPTGTVDASTPTATTPPNFAGIAVVVVILGLVYFAYRHFHKKK